MLHDALTAMLQVPTIAVELVEFEANTTVRCADLLLRAAAAAAAVLVQLV